jgi:putative copper resistance protein D
MNQPFSWHHLGVWNFGVVPLALMAVAGLVYALGARRTKDWPVVRSVCFTFGLVVTFLATESFIGVYDDAYQSDHMVQHLLLIMVAAPLFALATPLDLAYRSGTPTIRRLLDGRVMSAVTNPLVALALYFVIIPVTHLTNFVNLTIEDAWIHHFEHLLFLVVGYLFFRAAFGMERGVTLHPGLRLVYVMAAVPVDTFTGLALNMTTKIPFSAYPPVAPAGASRAWMLLNIHLSGSIMWVCGDALMLLACIPITVTWVKWETDRTRELDKILDAQGI